MALRGRDIVTQIIKMKNTIKAKQHIIKHLLIGTNEIYRGSSLLNLLNKFSTSLINSIIQEHDC